MDELLRQLENICQVAENYPDSTMGPCEEVSVDWSCIDDLEEVLGGLANAKLTPTETEVVNKARQFIKEGYEVPYEDGQESMFVFSSSWLDEFNRICEAMSE